MASHRFDSSALFSFSSAHQPQQTPSPKPPPHPSCAVFSDSIPDMSSPPQLPLPALSPDLDHQHYPHGTRAPMSPEAAPQDLYDYFQYTNINDDGSNDNTNSHPAAQLSSAAPLGSATDYNPRLSHPDDVATGAWYAFSKGFQTPFGTKHFADHNHHPSTDAIATQHQQQQPQRRPRRNDGLLSCPTIHDKCQQPCPYCSRCHTTRYPTPSTTSPSTTESSHHNTRHHHAHSRSPSTATTPSSCSANSSPDGTPSKHTAFKFGACTSSSNSHFPTSCNSSSCYPTNSVSLPLDLTHESCDHDMWSRPIVPCYVDSLPQQPGNGSSAVAPNAPNAAPRNYGNLADANQNSTNALAEITADQAADGIDVQGIPWETLPFSRADYRATRLTDQTRTNSPDYSAAPDGPNYHLKDPNCTAQYYDFFSNARAVKCSIVHFQLRNLAWATSKHDVYVMHDESVVHWDAGSKCKTQVLDLSGSDTSAVNGLGKVQISTMIAKDDLIIAGGFYGEMVAKNMRSGCIIHNRRITFDDNAITNAIDIFDNTIMTSNNDCLVRCFDINTFQRKTQFRFDKPVNHATRQPNGKMVVVAGDENVIQVINGDTGDSISHLRGHDDYSFATGWHPNGCLFATGSQDRTCRVWDVRNMAHHISVLGAHLGAVRSLRFSSCGRFLVMAEPRDFVHIYDVKQGLFDTCQEIDFFGEIAGIAVTPESEGLYIAVSDRLYSSVLEYERRGSSVVSDLML